MSFDSNTKSIVAYMLAHTTTLVACIFSRRLLVAVVPVGSVDGTTAIHGRQPEQTYTLTYNPTAEQTSGAQKTSQQSIRHPNLPVTPAADLPTDKPKYKSPQAKTFARLSNKVFTRNIVDRLCRGRPRIL
jgi:hypothetical protein